MALNPDPRPGRWILPLVVLGMIAFTFFFVRELPEASPDTTLATTTTTSGEDDGGNDTTTSSLPDAVQLYLTELDRINEELQALQTEMVAINAGFDADPREIEFSDAVSRFEALISATRDLEEQVAALTVPSGLEVNHDALLNAINFAAGAAEDALAGLRSTDTGELRRAAAEAYQTAVADFGQEVDNTRAAAAGGTDA